MTQPRLLRDARQIFDRAVLDCGVDRALKRKLSVRVESGRTVLRFDGEELDLTQMRHLRIVAAGKAAAAMLAGFLDHVPFVSGCDMRGVLIAPNLPERLPRGFQFFAGGHPLPNQASFDGARAALDLAPEASTLQDGICLFLFSGGASAMMELPLAQGITLDETVAFYRLLVHSGATISEINCIRKHFSAVKGGRLAVAAGETPSLTLLVSDVAPRHLDALGSGPTMPDPSTIAECRELLARYRLEEALPESIRRYFASPWLEETPKPGHFAAKFCVLLDSDDLGEAAAQNAHDLGYHAVLDNTCDDWDYAEAATYLLQRLRELRVQYERVCLLSTGEITVAVPPNLQHGAIRRGGRNQHFALHAATLLMPSDLSVAVLSAGSDGIDGNSEAAGAITGYRLLQAEAALEDARLSLANFDSSAWLAARGATIVTGPTGNNLRDLRLLLAATDREEGAP